ncbi:hypothetical protein DV733_07620 [Halapricum salinum]|uniref:Uncharacterized protein n=1 Tax=Halapricum salinum TaxID=1457250 RepID=A0A4D6HBX4_9EURY|nr:hypothetical protein DV733_07620 [Halapricum salinum]
MDSSASDSREGPLSPARSGSIEGPEDWLRSASGSATPPGGAFQTSCSLSTVSRCWRSQST